MTLKKLQRNKVYVVSGIVMIVSALAIAYFDYRKISIFIPKPSPSPPSASRG